MESFGEIIRDLTGDFPFHYIETRDKTSSQTKGEVKYDVETSGHDIVNVIQALELDDRKYFPEKNDFVHK